MKQCSWYKILDGYLFFIAIVIISNDDIILQQETSLSTGCAITAKKSWNGTPLERHRCLKVFLTANEMAHQFRLKKKKKKPLKAVMKLPFVLALCRKWFFLWKHRRCCLWGFKDKAQTSVCNKTLTREKKILWKHFKRLLFWKFYDCSISL